MTDSLAAALSDEGSTNVTVAPLAVTDDTETLVGSANPGRNDPLADRFTARLGRGTGLADISMTRPIAITIARLIHSFLTQSIMSPIQGLGKDANRKMLHEHFPSFPAMLERQNH
jgi:hypothetical protein